MVTNRQCRYIMRAIIRLGFNNEIPKPIMFTFTDPTKGQQVSGYKFPVDGVAGCDDYGNYIIAVDRSGDLLDVFDTIAHELTHIWQWENGLNVNHDKIFFNKLTEIKGFFF